MDNYITELNQFGIIEINGEDATAFLQAQLTSDLHHLNDQGVQFSAWCNPQGKIISNFILVRQSSAYYLILAADMAATVCRRLAMYVLRSRVSIINRSNELRCHGLVGEALSFIDKQPELIAQCIRITLPDRFNHRVMIISPVATSSFVSHLVSAELTHVDSTNWQIADILAGIAWITENTSEMVIPQELELDKLNGLSLDKGCFPGQEVIARLHYRGTVKYGLYRGECISPDLKIQAANKLYTSSAGESCGMIINILDDGTQHLHMLAIINHHHATLGLYYLDQERSISIKFTAATPQSASRV